MLPKDLWTSELSTMGNQCDVDAILFPVKLFHSYFRTSNFLKPSASPSLRLIKELDLDVEDWEWEDVLPSVDV